MGLKLIDWTKLARMQGELEGISQAIEMCKGDVDWMNVATMLKEHADTLGILRELWMEEVSEVKRAQQGQHITSR